MIKKVYILLIVLIFIIAAKAPRIKPGPEKIPNIKDEMLTPEYWLENAKDKDLVFLSRNKYQQLYNAWVKKKLIIDIESFPERINTLQLKQWLKEDFSYFKRAGQYHQGDQPMTEKKRQKIFSNVNLQNIKGSKQNAKWGMAVESTALMLFPTEKIITAKSQDIEFNIVAHSRLRLAEPLVILHKSKDGKWLFVASAIGRGWVKQNTVGISDNKALIVDYIQQANMVLVEPEGKISYNNVEKKARMGCWVKPDIKEKMSVFVPIRLENGKILIKRAKIDEKTRWKQGFLNATAETMIKQAFKLLNTPYGWGGHNGAGDCSELIRQIGLCCGMIWPRSTAGLSQGFRVKKIISGKLNGLKPGMHLLLLPGHIMLYLGEKNGRQYVIHNLYGIHGLDKSGAFIRRVARVIVSDLTLGQGSLKGSLKERLKFVIDLNQGLDNSHYFK